MGSAELQPDFDSGELVNQYASPEFRIALHKFAIEIFGDQDLINLPRIFLDGAYPDFPEYVVSFSNNIRAKLDRRFRLRLKMVNLWNPVTTLIGILALEAIMQIQRLPEQLQSDYPLLLKFMHLCPYWKNGLGVEPVVPATRLAIDTHLGNLPNSNWVDQLVHQLSKYMQCML
jgi:hypothetical protein